ncbi:heat shock protein [Tieghemostelium lacteum]|uniref:Heat shock protein n=1 Tax=Tieghemostelium lacteum TaxID=361077 RepID=A0A151Z9V1_TIELA|nr:heat shock protein [Tieghemostelium lacteum]|eukprot:KYQ90705.1 heat shock protein [Tieghemostelium lacteum]
MSFFGITIKDDSPLPLELEEHCYFHLTRVILPPTANVKGKVYLMVSQKNIEDEEEEEKEEEEEEEIDLSKWDNVAICCLEDGVKNQSNVNLKFSADQEIFFSVQGAKGCSITMCGTVEFEDPSDEEMCEDENCLDHHHGDSEEEEFTDSYDDDDVMDFDEDSDDEEIPDLVPIKKQGAKITEIPDEPITPDTSSKQSESKKQPQKKQEQKPKENPQVKQEKQQPKKQEQQPKKQDQKPKQNNKQQEKKEQPNKQEQPKKQEQQPKKEKQQPKKEQQNGKKDNKRELPGKDQQPQQNGSKKMKK